MISVCLTTYNGAAYIIDQVNSILRSPKVGELIISDDGSVDSTLELITKIEDPRIRLVRGPGKGLINNFEFALSLAQGDYIFLADQDDIWLEGKVDVILYHLARADLVVSNCKVVDSQLNITSDSFFRLRNSGPGFIKNLTQNSFLGCCMAFRRDVLSAALPFPRNIAMHDWWIGLVASLTGRVAFIDETLLLYRRHSSNASDTAEKSSASIFKQLSWRFSMLGSLMVRMIKLKAGRYNIFVARH